MSVKSNTKMNRLRKALYLCVISLFLVVSVPIIPYVIEAHAEDIKQNEAEKVVALQSPAINLWNNVRQRTGEIEGSSQVKSVDSGILINKTGEDWRRFRMEKLLPYGAYLIGGVLGAIILFYLVSGKTLIPGGRTGKRISRFTLNQRTAHWFTAGIFWLLGITGLILLYGRVVLIPLLGAEGFSVTAAACKEMHNLFGPLFLLAVLAMLVLYVKDNIFNLKDLTWFAKGGGMFGGHVSAGRFNAGEKTWFWLVMIFGLSLSISGLILDFAVFGQGREVMALSHMFHGISALVLIAISFGHIYLGTIGVEGTLDSMTTGYVDAAWATAHHDEWYEEMTASDEVVESKDIKGQSDPGESGIPSPDTGN